MPVSRLEQLQGIGVDRAGDAADGAADPEILRLENLDTDLRPVESALEATRAATGDDGANSYLPFSGSSALRRAAASHVSRLSGVEYDARESCVITAGGLNGIFNALLAMLEPGDEVIVTDPIYVGLLNRIRLAGGVPRLVPLVPSPHGWRLDRAALAAAASPRVRVVLMMSPSMPTGCVLDAEEWEAVAALVRASGAWLLYDAAMERILFRRPYYLHPASLEGMAERTVTVGSLSKEQRMIGWRIGWVVGPPAIVEDIKLVGISNVVCQVGIAQAAAVAALEAPRSDLEAAVAEWQRRHDRVVAELEGFPIIPAHGGWSLLLDCAPLGFTGEEAATRLARIAKIAATPMVHWGSGKSARYVRFVFANESCDRLTGMGARVRAALSRSTSV